MSTGQPMPMMASIESVPNQKMLAPHALEQVEEVRPLTAPQQLADRNPSPDEWPATTSNAMLEKLSKKLRNSADLAARQYTKPKSIKRAVSKSSKEAKADLNELRLKFSGSLA